MPSYIPLPDNFGHTRNCMELRSGMISPVQGRPVFTELSGNFGIGTTHAMHDFINVNNGVATSGCAYGEQSFNNFPLQRGTLTNNLIHPFK